MKRNRIIKGKHFLKVIFNNHVVLSIVNHKEKQMKQTVHASELTIRAMVSGNEKTYHRVINNNNLMEWTGIGWIKLNEATEEDCDKYPVVVYKRD